MGIVSRCIGLGLIVIALAALGPGCNSGGLSEGDGVIGDAPTIVEPAQQPRISMNGEGSGMVAWNDGYELWVKRYDADAGWEESVRIAERPTHYPDEPDVAIFNEDAVVIWREAHLRIYSLGHLLGQGWQSPQLVAQHLDGLDDPRLAFNTHGRSGAALAVWRGRLEPPLAPVMGAYGRRYVMHSGSWQDAVRLDTDNAGPAEEIQSVSVGTNHAGGGAAVWSHWGNSIHTGWGGQAERISAADVSVFDPRVAFDADGNGLAVWIQYGSVYACRYDNTTENWNIPFEIEDYHDVLNAASAPDISMNGTGVAFVVWWGAEGGIYANRFVNGSFGTAQRIDLALGGEGLAPTTYASRPKVAVDADGHARVIWDSSPDICSVRFDARGGSWEFAETLGTGRRPDIDTDPSGRVIAVWWDMELKTRVWEPPISSDPPDEWSMTFSGSRGNYQNIFTVETDGDGFRELPVPVTTDATADSQPTLSPDGSRIAFVRDDEIWIVDADGDNLTQLTNGPTYKREPTFDHSGTYLVYEDGPAIVKRDLEDGTVMTLTDEGGPSQPSVSPDGNWIAFSAFRELPGGGGGGQNIWIMAMDGSGTAAPLTSLTSATEAMYSSPAWSPDGSRIVCRYYDGNMAYDIHSLVRATGVATKLAAEDGPVNGEPVFTPDGEAVVYSSHYYWYELETYVWEIWKVPADGSGSAERFGAIGAWSHHPSFAGKP